MANEESISEQIPGALPSANVTAEHEGKTLEDARVSFEALLAQQKAGEELNPAKASQAAKDARASKKAAKAKAAKEAPSEPAEAAPEAKAEAKAEAKPDAKPEPKAKPSETERLRAKLLLAGAPKKAIEQLSDEDVREWWTNQEEREADRAAALARASEAEKRLKETTSKTSEPLKGVPTEELDLDEIASDLSDQFGEDESGAILKALKALTAPLQAKVEAFDKMLAEARKGTVERISKENRERLSEKVPHLSESDEAWGIVHGIVERVFQEDASKFSSAEAAYDHALKVVYGPMLEAKAKASAPEPEAEEVDEKARIAASSPTPPSAARREKKATPMEAAYAAFKHLDKGDPEDIEGAKRTYSRALVQ